MPSKSLFWNKKQKLFTNCLLTRYPVVLIDPPQSLFYYGQSWKTLESLLYEHGYQVKKIKLPFYKTSDRLKLLSKWLSLQQNQPFHYVVDSVTYKTLHQELSKILLHPKNTLTILNKNGLNQSSNEDSSLFHLNLKDHSVIKSPWLYQLHQIWLNHHQELASEYSELLETITLQQAKFILDHFDFLAQKDFID